jgi:hypothetical protein
MLTTNIVNGRVSKTYTDKTISDLKLQFFDQAIGHSTLGTVGVGRHSFKPLNTINTKYSKINESIHVVVDVIFNTSSPTVHLDNFNEIHHVHCNNSQIELWFINQSRAFVAYNEWNFHIGNLIVLAGWEKGCHGTYSESTFLVNKLKITNNQLILYDLVPLRRIDIVTTWFIAVSHFGVEPELPIHIKKSPQNEHKKYRRRFDNLAKDFTEIIINPLKSLMNRKISNLEYTKNSSQFYNFTSNYDTINNVVINQERLIYDVGTSAVNCLNCYTTGKADVRIEMSGFLFDITM